MKCPHCGAVIKDGSSKCPYCRAEIDNSNYHPINEVMRSLDASSIYEKNLKGVAIVINHEDNSVGTGFVYSDNGLLITNSHVICTKSGFAKKLIVVIDKRSFPAHVINTNDYRKGQLDLALLQIESNEKFHSLKIGNSDDVRPGQTVISIGNSKGQGLSITQGIISDTDRKLLGFGDDLRYFMSDVAMNQGNSGGPLFNEDGKVIAIAVIKKMDAEGMNYFIPINDAMNVIKDWGY